ncbi:hypothetical protein [Wohlfahrtiimonas populi]|uniref:hypothetical protein n=1 Tax=Wohlfahrtiimonas populi TaxID=1940240 RepID=UPI00098D2D25|nr:hypothetical protein [Wohlfahrtiimonas populi]
MLSKKELEKGSTYLVKGGDGKEYILLQAKGELDGVAGIFEYLYDPVTKAVTHQRYIKNGKITGRPNQKVGR